MNGSQPCAGSSRRDPRFEDYVFQEGPADLNAGDAPVRTVRLSELLSNPDRPLVVYQFMYGKLQTSPCPMCTLWIDGWNGVAHHLAQNGDFVIAARGRSPDATKAGSRPGLAQPTPLELRHEHL